MYAWVTSAVTEDQVDKALVLAGSLRRVRTAMSLVVITTTSISKTKRDKLQEGFDLVIKLQEDDWDMNGNPELMAVVHAFSLMAFKKCVYLFQTMMVMKNCDDLFDQSETLAMGMKANGHGMDPHVFLYRPNFSLYNILRKTLLDTRDRDWRSCLVQAISDNTSQIWELDALYNVSIFVGHSKGAGSSLSDTMNANMINFADIHPMDVWRKGDSRAAQCIGLGEMETRAFSHGWSILTEDIVGKQEGMGFHLTNAGNDKEPVAIVGMSFRLPGANSPDELWNLLIEGRDAIKKVPQHRWIREHSGYEHDPQAQAGFLDCPIDEFDAKFFGISTKEATVMDPQQRLLLEVSWEALEDAGIDPLSLHGTQTGVFVGSWMYNYRDLAMRTPGVNFFRSYMGNSIGTGSARLSHFLGCTGPSIPTESGCSSAIVAVDLACKSLRNRECNAALACGVNLLIHPFNHKMMEGILSSDFRCKTFDAKANGFARAEGCATLVMKRLSDALKDGDNIWGLVRGTAVAQEGVSKSLGTPTVHCESLAMRLALQDAGVDGGDVSYVETHGTGTAVGDPVEVAAITRAYKSSERETPMLIGSVKTNVGHTESVSGITGIIKVILSLKHEKIPPHINFEELNPEINLEEIPAEIPMCARPWPRSAYLKRLAGVSSFGISGTDGHAIIEESPLLLIPKISFKEDRPLHALKLSAKCPESLKRLVSKYEEILTKDEAKFQDVCYSANTGRSTFSHRAVVVASDSQQAAVILKEKTFKTAEVQSGTASLGFLFTGQGSQYHGMASQLYASSPVFRIHFDKASDILQKRYSISIKDVIWGKSSSNDEVSRTLYSQTSIFCVEYCLFKLWESWGVKPDYVMGHSLGEFAAAVAAGILGLEDALMLVAERSRLIDDLPPGKMLAIKANKRTVDQTISNYKISHPHFWADYAALNSPEQTVLAGDSKLIEDFGKFCTETGLKSIILASTHAFHSRHMDPMLEAYRKIASNVRYATTMTNGKEFPKYISGLDGKMVNADKVDADYWVRHTREKVNFIGACQVGESEGCTLFLEVGPHPILSALTMMNLEGTAVTCLPSLRRNVKDWSVLLDTLGKLYLSNWKGSISWKGFDSGYARTRVSVPFYQFNRKSYWLKFRHRLPNLHPLVGKAILNPTNVFTYETEMRVRSTSYLQDHVIGNTIVFPGAGFLEMCLAAGHAAIHRLKNEMTKPRRPIALKDVKIATPLALHEHGICIIQTTVNCDENNQDGYPVKICRHSGEDAGDREWVLHAMGKFHPAVTSSDNLTAIDIAGMQEKWEKFDNSDFYQSLPDVGLRFGSTFQSLEVGWRNDGGVLFKVKVPEGQPASYIIHPIVVDAMLQALMIYNASGSSSVKKKLQVPVQIGDFVWNGSAQETPEKYIYCKTDEPGGGKVICHLLNESGDPLASMSSVEFLETTVKLIENMIQQQSIAMPKVWEEIYKPNPGPLQNSLDMREAKLVFPYEFKAKLEQLSAVPPQEIIVYNNLCSLTHYFVLDALYSCGWKPEVAAKFSVEHLLNVLSLKISFKNYIRFFLRLTARSGILMQSRVKVEVESFETYWFPAKPPTHEEIRSQLKVIQKPEELSRADYRMIAEIGMQLGDVLKGKVGPLSIIFPDNVKKPNASLFYEQAIDSLKDVAVHTTQNIHEAVKGVMKASAGNSPFRILEVGAGTGSYTKLILGCMDTKEIPIEYYYTDVSPSFFAQAEREFAEYGTSIKFKKLNMEEDPMSQGFTPGYFDFLLACEVLHVAKDIKKTLKRLRSLLKPGGVLQIVETTAQDPRITFVFGLLEGYWQFEDFEFRKDHTTLTPDMWKEALHSANFCNVECFSAYMGVHGIVVCTAGQQDVDVMRQVGPKRFSWILFDDGTTFTRSLGQRLKKLNRKVFRMPRTREAEIISSEEKFKEEVKELVRVANSEGRKLEGFVYLWGLGEEQDPVEISLPFVTLCQVLTGLENPPTKISVITRGVFPTEGTQVENPFPGSLIGLVRSMNNEMRHINISHLDMSPQEEMLSQVDEIFCNMWEENLLSAVFRGGLRLQPKVVSCKIADEYLTLPHGCDRFQLVLPTTKLISDLEFTFLDQFPMGEDQVEFEVRAMALNFRDILTILKPIPEFDKFNAVGLDFAGVITKVGSKVSEWKVGDRVIGMQTDNKQALPSHIQMRADEVIPLADHLTFCEGATLPAVFFTAYYCLVIVAKMKRGETLLLHTASGGVGLCAIQLAKQFGANIIATAGSPRKRTFLHNLGIQHVFNSRTTDFGEEILKVTGGRGVDIVLNSLTGPGFKEESLRALAKNGRFIEMSKLNVWKSEEVEVLRPDVFYAIIDIPTLGEALLKELNQTARKYITEGLIRPIPYERFDGLNIRGALNYMQRAKHIGKIVCVMPELKSVGKGYHKKTPMFNDNSTYLVTGGLGGIGFQVVKWILSSGGKHVVIAGRSPPRPEVQEQIDSWNSSGMHVESFQVDIGNYDQCLQLFEHINSTELGFPPLRGVMSAAGVLADAVIENQNWEKFLHCYNPKMMGTWNLHNLTKDMLLEHFVLFSSFSATFGSPGQSNHSSSNSFKDTLAHYRRSQGLPATTVNWGNWGEVGVATEVDFPGVTPISTCQGIYALEVFLRTQKHHTGVANIQSFSLLSKLFPTLKYMVDDKKLLGDESRTVLINTDEFWNKVDNAPERRDRVDLFNDLIKGAVKTVLNSAQDELIEDNAEFSSLGVDSLMMIEMKNALQNVLGTRMILTAAHLKDCNTPPILANRLVDIFEEIRGERGNNAPNKEELRELIREDSVLPPHIRCDSSHGPPKPVEDVESVLLTGVTGNLGPYLLRELCERPSVSKVYCLIRKVGSGSPEERLKSVLEAHNLLNGTNLDKVECVQGDITDAHFGLTQSNYESLASEVDAVVHSAVLADHTAKYCKTNEANKYNVRNVNVGGMLKVLEFSVEKKVKHVFHASTLVAVATVDEAGCLSEDWQNVGEFDSVEINAGYPISKHVCEQLVKQAVERGVPCKAFRFPLIGGHSQTGRIDFKSSHLLLRCLTAFKLGCLSDFPYPIPCIPVDQCAQLSLRVFFHENAPSDVYNISQRHPVLEQDLVGAVKDEFGIEVELVDFPTFLAKIQGESESSPLAPFKALYEQESFGRTVQSPAIMVLQKYVENSDRFFKTEKMRRVIPEFDELLESSHVCMQRDLRYLKDTGVFEKFGIRCRSE